MDFYLLGYRGQGILIPAQMCTIPYGGIYVEAANVAPSVLESAKVAYNAFQSRHGPLPFGVVVRFSSPVEYIDGRSADVAFYVALFSLVNGNKPIPATGVIGEDGSIGGVSHVYEKVEAAKDLVIIPYANRHFLPEDSPVVAVKNLEELDALLLSLGRG